ncbi:MAG: hypothetical protein EBR46_09095 [Betaproteobacteria bacterium]|nr:hypothetical protein [Betaproteobacteria bacterium]
MLRTEYNQLLSHGSVSEIAEAAVELARQDPRNDGDVFLKKAEAWAYQAYFLSTHNEVEEAQGRFDVAPVDGLVMSFLEARVAPSNRLPTGHLYEPALNQAMEALAAALDGALAEEAADALELLDRDLLLRDYLLERRLEHFYS